MSTGENLRKLSKESEMLRREGISLALKGKPKSESHCRSLSLAKIGKTQTSEAVQNRIVGIKASYKLRAEEAIRRQCMGMHSIDSVKKRAASIRARSLEEQLITKRKKQESWALKSDKEILDIVSRASTKRAPSYITHQGKVYRVRSCKERKLFEFFASTGLEFCYEGLVIRYRMEDESVHKYLPDFYFPFFNLVIEFKMSCYLARPVVQLKKNATLDAGYRFLFVTELDLENFDLWKAKFFNLVQEYANQQPSSVESEKVQRLVESGTPDLITTYRDKNPEVSSTLELARVMI